MLTKFVLKQNLRPGMLNKSWFVGRSKEGRLPYQARRPCEKLEEKMVCTW